MSETNRRTSLQQILQQASNYPTLKIQKEGNSAVSVQVQKCATELDVDDLRPVKQLIYNALCPGIMEISYEDLYNYEQRKEFFRTSFPREQILRNEWELLPLWEDEIHCTDTGVVIAHRNRDKIIAQYDRGR